MFPPPDPHEQLWMAPTRGIAVPAPMAVFAGGAPTPEADRIANRILDARPGILVVLAR